MRDVEVRALLERALPELPPPSRVDAALAVRRAHRQRRRRRVATVTAAAVALPAVVVSAVAVAVADRPAPGGGPVTSPAAPGSTAPAPPSPGSGTARPSPAPVRFDPLVRTLRVGWTPPSLIADQWAVDAHSQSYAGLGRGEGDVGLVVTVLVAGRRLPDEGGLGMPMKPVRRPAAPVDGRPAVCLAEPDLPGSCSTLRWQYASGAWAQVSYASVSRVTVANGGPRPDYAEVKARADAAAGGDAAVVRRVAESVSLGGVERVRLPFRLIGSTAELIPTRTLVDVRRSGTGSWGERWSASVTLDTAPVPAGADFAGEARGVTIGLLDQPNGPDGTPAGRDQPPNATVNGQPAWISPSGDSFVQYRVRGTRVSVSFHQRVGSALDRYRDVRIVRTPADLSSWTDRPLG